MVLDAVGAGLFGAMLSVLRPTGRFLTVDSSSGALGTLDFRTLYLKHLTLVGCTLGSREDFFELLRAFRSGSVRPVVARTFRLEQAREAPHGALQVRTMSIPAYA